MNIKKRRLNAERFGFLKNTGNRRGDTKFDIDFRTVNKERQSNTFVDQEKVFDNVWWNKMFPTLR